jgi:peptidoglycan hydrolase-like protein with peptidoglycan-binding domain
MSDVVKRGSFGERVKQWQNFLISAGYSLPLADGAFGPATERETIKFQGANGLKPDGVVGTKTWSFVTTISNNTPLSSKWPSQDYNSMVNFYGPVGENTTSLDLPYSMKLAWDYSTVVSRITCNRKVANSLHAIFEKTLKTYGLVEIRKLRLDLFGGCLNVRKMRGSANTWSTHSWGAAVDLDPDRNGLRMTSKEASFAKPAYKDFWKIVESEGWTSLGKAIGRDYMHFQAANIK